MNRRTGLKSLALGGAAWLAGWSTAPADEKKKKDDKRKKDKDKDDDKEGEIPLTEVPEAVRKAADGAAASVKWELAYLDDEDRQVTYELVGKDEKGREVAVVLTPEGKVELVETEIPLADVPAIVMERLEKKYPKFKATMVFELKQGGKVAGYDFEGKRPKDKDEIGIFVSADGKEIDIDG